MNSKNINIIVSIIFKRLIKKGMYTIMTKVEFINAFVKKANVSKKDAEKYVKAFLETVVDGLNNDNLVQLTGFGSFKKRKVEEREGHNPKNVEEKIIIPASNRVTFTPGRSLKDAVNVKEEKKAAPKKVTKKK